MTKFNKNGTKKELKPLESKTIQSKAKPLVKKSLTTKTPLKVKTQLKAKSPMKKSTKPIKKKPAKKDNRFSILVNDLTKCVECGEKAYKHEVFYGNNKQHSIKHGLVIPLCIIHHTESPTGIHHNKDLCDKWHKIAQLKFEETHTREDFRKIFGRSYLKDKLD